MDLDRDEQPNSDLNQVLEKAINEITISEGIFHLKLGPFEFHMARHVTRSRRKPWSRWVSFFTVLMTLTAAVIKIWFTNE